MLLKNDIKLDIATANVKARRSMRWLNKTVHWSTIVERLKTTERTHETHKEYMEMPKDQQDEIKDVGGFFGGMLNNGRRLKTNVAYRQLLTFDIDKGTTEFWDMFTLLFPYASCIYSTHKHSPLTPRYRVLIPLDREVLSDEYQAIARKIAGMLDIELFDPTCFQIHQLMYWPSTSKDMEYFYDYQDGPILSADWVLSQYHNWKDVSQWPLHSKFDAAIAHGIKKQGDPLIKTNIIGSFCRQYPISEAIAKFLPEVYTETDEENRYTYHLGSTAKGVIVYDDVFAYSHHSTDPISHKLVNAFDLVRINLFGLQDEDSTETQPQKMPSFKAMAELISNDPAIRKQITIDNKQKSTLDFADIEVDTTTDEPADDSWMSMIARDVKGVALNTINNAAIILEHDPIFKNNLSYDAFEHRIIINRAFPWTFDFSYDSRFVSEMDLDNIENYIENAYKIGSAKITKALSVVCLKNAFHPVRSYLNSLQWDGVERLDTFFIKYMGVPDTVYSRAVTRKSLTAAAARIYKPGIKYDYAPVFYGPQGVRKSMLLDKLGGKWFSDSFTKVEGKEANEQVQGVWIVEIAELAAFKNSDAETIKHYIARRKDRFRAAYGRFILNYPRQCVFFGSTNEEDFLRDPTGNRRYWPLVVNAALAADVRNITQDEIDQIWAEAVQSYKAGEKLYLSDELEAEAKQIQKHHTKVDPREADIAEYLDKMLPDNWDDKLPWERQAFLKGDKDQGTPKYQRDYVCVAEIWQEVFEGTKKDMTPHNTRFIVDIMRNIKGWKRADKLKRFGVYGPSRYWYRVDSIVSVDFDDIIGVVTPN